MSSKCVRSFGPAVLLLATVLSLAPNLPLAGSRAPSALAAPVAAPAQSKAGATHAALMLTAQSPWVTPAQPRFELQTAIGMPPGAGQLELAVTVYRRLKTRTAFDQSLSGTPSGGVLDQLSPIAVPPGASTAPVDLPVETGTADQTAAIGLDCAGTGTCPGVYPVVVALQQARTGAVVARLNTFLTYMGAASTDPLRFALVLPFGAPVRIDQGTSSPDNVLRAPSHLTLSQLSGLVRALAAEPSVPTTLAVDPHTTQVLPASGVVGRQTLATLGTLSEAGSATEVPGTSYVPVDLGALAGAGLTGEITYQMEIGSATMAHAGVRTDPAATWITSGDVDQNLAAGLSDAGVSRVVVPDTSLASDPGRLGITQAFDLSLGRGTPTLAAASDSGLNAHFAAARRDPVLAAQQMLADLAFIQSELPYDPTTRGVVSVAPASPVADATFTSALLAGLAGNPVVRAVTLDEFFAEVPVGGNGEPSTRQPAPGGSGVGIPGSLANRISAARQRNDAFHSAVPGSPAVLGQLDDLLLASESNALTTTQQLDGVAAYERVLGGQLSQVQLSTVRAITLTSRTGRIPITFVSSAPYTLIGDVTLTSDKFVFPEGATRPDFTISRSTNPLPMEVEARTSGVLPLQVTLIAPRTDPGAPPLVIAHGRLTVRSTATSLVGVVLTLLAIAVLAAWWIRTWRRGRRLRHADTGRSDRRAPAEARP